MIYTHNIHMHLQILLSSLQLTEQYMRTTHIHISTVGGWGDEEDEETDALIEGIPLCAEEGYKRKKNICLYSLYYYISLYIYL